MSMNETTVGQGSSPDTGTPPAGPRRHHHNLTGAVILIVLGVLFLAENLIPEFSFSDYWPILLIAIGASFLWRARHSA
jgi:hypothetical protein